ncbi:unnamed protein product [Cyprideis torosa]|uniref:Uncharacterized protein n=1 Tax=Cyprideis torosa TaxID=163714 RepID=A0A7R8W6I6_9CRUS|nr:unnamed protein product [Cyprideis torosa]CAG0881085.1 unnamed protein product [Cyprideis torosa]
MDDQADSAILYEVFDILEWDTEPEIYEPEHNLYRRSESEGLATGYKADDPNEAARFELPSPKSDRDSLNPPVRQACYFLISNTSPVETLEALQRMSHRFFPSLTFGPAQGTSLRTYASQISGSVLQRFVPSFKFPEDVTSLLSVGFPVRCSLSTTGKYCAVMHDHHVEIVSLKGMSNIVIGSFEVSPDSFSQWRKISWSPSDDLLAISSSTGAVEIKSILGTPVTTVNLGSFNPFPSVNLDFKRCIVGLFFTQARGGNVLENLTELIIVDAQGNLESYLLTTSGKEELYHEFSFQKWYPSGITTVGLISSPPSLLIAGLNHIGEIQESIHGRGGAMGLSLWRLVSSRPYYVLADIGSSAWMENRKEPSLISRIIGLAPSSTGPLDPVFKVSVSSRHAACLHVSGALSIWRLPSMLLRFIWKYEDQMVHLAQAFSKSWEKGIKRTVPLCESKLQKHVVDVAWWDEETVGLVRGNGVFSLLPIHGLREDAEQTEVLSGPAQLLAVNESKTMFALECEAKRVPKAVLEDKGTELEFAEDETDEKLNHPDDLDGLHPWKQSIKSVLFWITGSEWFNPSRKLMWVVTRKYRLLSLESTSPEALLKKKITAAEYGEALDIAQKYKLDTDQVYLAQWKASRGSHLDLKDYLSRVKKRAIVLKEVQTRLPDTIEAQRALLTHGLRGTDIDTLLRLGRASQDKGVFQVSPVFFSEEECPGLDFSTNPSVVEQRRAWEQNLIHRVGPKLNLSQRHLLEHRSNILQFLDRLDIYEEILKSRPSDCNGYCVKFYESFRSQSPIEAALSAAHKEDFAALDCLLAYYHDLLFPHYLAILSNIPESAPLDNYKFLLPRIDRTTGSVETVKPARLRNEDWSEAGIFRTGLENAVPTVSVVDALYEDMGESFRGTSWSPEVLSIWYLQRANVIAKRTKLVDIALDFIQTGLKNNIPGLQSYYEYYQTMDTLMYDVDTSLTLTLEDIIHMDPLKILELMCPWRELKGQELVRQIRKFVLPYAQRQENPSELLREFLLSVSVSDLNPILEILRASISSSSNSGRGSPGCLGKKSSKESNREPPLFADHRFLLELAVDAIYLHKSPPQIPTAYFIMKYCDRLDLDQISSFESSRRAELEIDLEVCELLERYEITRSPIQIKNMKTDENEIRKILTQLTRAPVRIDANMDYGKVLQDALSLQRMAFPCISPVEVTELWARALLNSGCLENIRAARDVISPSPGVSSTSRYLIPFSRSVELVLDAAREYFNSCANYLEPEMNLARCCLELIDEPYPEIEDEKCLIDSLPCLVERGLFILPIKVRCCEDRLELIERSLSLSPDNYRDEESALELALLLHPRIDPVVMKERVFKLLAEYAYSVNDPQHCARISRRILEEKISPPWELFRSLALHPSSVEGKLRLDLLDAALEACPDREILPILTARENLASNSMVLGGHMEKIGWWQSSTTSGDEVLGDQFAVENEQKCNQTCPGKTFNSASLIWQEAASLLKEARGTTSGFLKEITEQLVQKSDDPLRSTKYPLGLHGKQKREPEKLELGLPSFLFAPHEKLFPVNECPWTSLNADTEAVTTLFTALSERMNNGGDIKTVLPLCVQEDVSLAVSYLLDNVDPVNSCPHTQACLKVLLYSVAIRASLKNDSDVLLKPPRDVIATAPASKEMQRACLALKEYHRGRVLHSLAQTVDVERFATDEAYRDDSILGLVMTLNDDMYDVGWALAKQYHMDTWELAWSYYLFLVTDCRNKGTTFIREQLQSKGLIPILMEKPEQFRAHSNKKLLPLISGLDHALLNLYYGILMSAHDGNATTHSKCLQKLKGCGLSELDYKALLSDENSVEELLFPLITSENQETLVLIVSELSRINSEKFNPSQCRALWCYKSFMQLRIDTLSKAIKYCKKRKQDEWTALLPLLEDWLKHLEALNIPEITDNLSETVQELLLDFECRCASSSVQIKYFVDLVFRDYPLNVLQELSTFLPSGLDLPTVMSEAFQRALENAFCCSTLLEVENSSHLPTVCRLIQTCWDEGEVFPELNDLLQMVVNAHRSSDAGVPGNTQANHLQIVQQKLWIFNILEKILSPDDSGVFVPFRTAVITSITSDQEAVGNSEKRLLQMVIEGIQEGKSTVELGLQVVQLWPYLEHPPPVEEQFQGAMVVLRSAVAESKMHVLEQTLLWLEELDYTPDLETTQCLLQDLLDSNVSPEDTLKFALMTPHEDVQVKSVQACIPKINEFLDTVADDSVIQKLNIMNIG